MKKFFSAILALAPVLSQYKSFIPGMDMASFLIICMVPFVLTSIRKIRISYDSIKFKKSLFIYITYVIFTTLINCLRLENLNFGLILMRTAKFAIIPLIIILFNDSFFDYDFFIKVFKKFSLIATIYIIIQTIFFYMFKRTLPGIFENLILQGDYFNISYESASSLFIYRPTSFFIEPASFSSYVTIYLIYVLFEEKINKRKYLHAILVTIAIICSTSGMGYVYMSIVWLIYIYSTYLKNISKKKLLTLITIVVLGIPLLIVLMKTSFAQKVIYRIFDGSSSGGNAIQARTVNKELFKDFDNIDYCIGKGYGNPPQGEYLNSLAYTIYTTGYLGLILVIKFFYDIFKYEGNKYKDVVLLIWLLSFCIAVSFSAISIIFYLSLITKNNNIKKEE